MVKLQLIKAVLYTGKTIYLRQMKIGDTEIAAQQVSAKANGDPHVLQMMIQKALVQNLLMKIAPNEGSAPRDVTPMEREDLNSILNVGEFSQILQVIAKITGAEDVGKPVKISMVTDS